jgi:signal transduction histidine kinase
MGVTVLGCNDIPGMWGGAGASRMRIYCQGDASRHSVGAMKTREISPINERLNILQHLLLRLNQPVSRLIGIGLTAALLAAALISPIVSRSRVIEGYRLETRDLFWIPTAAVLQLRQPMIGEARRPMSTLPVAGIPVQVGYRFESAGPINIPYLLLIEATSGDVDIFVNRVPIYAAPQRSAPFLALSGDRLLAFTIPPELFHTGLNRLDLIISGAENRNLTGAIYLGPEPVLNIYTTRLIELREYAGRFLLILAGLTSLACWGAAIGSQGRRGLFLVGLAVLFVGLRACASSEVGTAVLGDYRLLADRSALAISLLAIGGLASRRLAPHLIARRLRLGVHVITLLTLMVAMPISISAPTTSWWVGVVAVLLASLPGLLSLGLIVNPQTDGDRDDRLPGYLLAAFGLPALLLALAGSISGGMLPWSIVLEHQYILLVLSLLLATCLLAGSLLVQNLYRALTEDSELKKLAKRQRRQLVLKSRLLRDEMRQRAILEERQRLVRDMHDGIGGQLVSLLTRVRAKRIPVSEIERELQAGLVDLRLVVDSLDNAGDNLSDALRSFEARARPQVADAGLKLVWKQPHQLASDICDPRAILNIYRILQEAVTNAVRHSKGTEISVSISRTRDQPLLIAVIVDDGIGLSPDDTDRRKPGKGLRNMSQRATAMGGRLVVKRASPQGGTQLVLEVPVSTPGDQGGSSEPDHDDEPEGALA